MLGIRHLAAVVLACVFCAGAAPVNPNATLETRALFDQLVKIQGEDRLLFGQYNGTSEGRSDRGDIEDMTGVKPGMNEWHVPYLYNFQYESKMARLHEDYASGMLIGFFWRMYNPITGGESSDTSDGAGGIIDIDTLLPGGMYHTNYLAQLDTFVEICEDLPKINGEPVPVFLRFLPEMSRGEVRWYKQAFCTPEQYKELWRVAYDYLVVTNGLNNILWHFNPNATDDASENKFGYREYYPGHHLVDICGRNTPDHYYLMGPDALDSMRHAIEVAEEGGKIVAISQQNSYHNNADLNLDGMVNPDEIAPVSNWWTEVWLDRLIEDDLLDDIAFSCAWKNGEAGEVYFLPYKGHEHEADFVAMCARPEILLAPDAPDLYAPIERFDATRVEFAGAESFASGELMGQLGWHGDADAFVVDAVEPGYLTATSTWSVARYGPGANGSTGTTHAVGAKLRFAETAVAIANKQIFQLVFTGRDDANLYVSYKRKDNGAYILNLAEDSGVSSTSKGSSIAPVEIGTTNGPGSLSRWLYLELSLTRGATTNDWLANAALYDVELDPGRKNPIDQFDLVFAVSETFHAGPVIPGFRVGTLADAGIADIQLDYVDVLSLPNDFSWWAFDAGLTGKQSDPLSDADEDGVDNLMEFARGGDPADPTDSGYAPVLRKNGDAMEWSHVLCDGVTYSVEFSTNLVDGSWSPAGVITTSGPGMEGFANVTNRVDVGEENDGYLRLEVRLP